MEKKYVAFCLFLLLGLPVAQADDKDLDKENDFDSRKNQWKVSSLRRYYAEFPKTEGHSKKMGIQVLAPSTG